MYHTAWRARVAGAAIIILLTLAAYLPALQGKFLWDDEFWTTDIAGLLRDVHGLYSIWFHPTALPQQYFPLAATSFWIDYQLWGFWTTPYHVENVLLHILSALLFWRLLRRLQVPGAWLAAAIFALHPVMVESVAWITERKNVLSLVLFPAALLAYGRFTPYWKEQSNSSPRRWGAYAVAFILFAAALLAKTTAFSLPAVILLICWWKRGTIRRADILPTLPFFAASIVFCLVAAWFEKNHIGAKGPAWEISFPERCLIAGRAIWFYAGKLLWPANLCFIYPRWRLSAGSWRQWLYPIGAVAVLLALWLARARIGRGPLTAGLFFVGTLFPALGFTNAYFMRYSFVCDHWTYLSSLGLIALAAALVTRLAEYFRAPVLLGGFTAVLLAVLAILTCRQSAIYADPESLWGDTVAKNPGAWVAQLDLGVLLSQQGRSPEGIAHYEAALQTNPDDPDAHNDLGFALKLRGENNEAIEQYDQALRLDPDFPPALINRGIALDDLGRHSEAIACYERLLRSDPDYPGVQGLLAKSRAILAARAAAGTPSPPTLR